MKRVVIESPFKGDTKKNISYARACMHHSILKGEAPFASHLLYTQEGVLDDKFPLERLLGITAGFVWGEKADLVAVYIDLGITDGMSLGIHEAKERGTPVEHRRLGKPWSNLD
jgi:hypothetical protein